MDMITFGYKSKFSSILRALASIGIGAVMIFATDATTTVVRIIAAFLFAAGVVSLAYGYANRKSGAMGLMIVNSIVDIAIGLILYISPTWVAGVIVVLIGIGILIFGVLQMIVLAGTMSLIGMGGFTLALSIIAVIGGIMLIFNPFSERVMSILAGIFLMFYGVSELLSMGRVAKAKAEYEIRFNKPSEKESADDQDFSGSLDNVRDVEYHKEQDPE